MSRHRLVRSLAALVAAIAVVGGLTTVGAGANLKGSYTSVGFSPGISGVEAELADVADVLRLYTELDGLAAVGAERIVFVYGIGHGSEVTAPVVSETVILTQGAEPFVATGSGPIDSPWDAFDDPLLGFDDPLLGFDDPLLGLEAVWGNGNVGIDPDDYGLVLFTMRYPDSNSEDNVQYNSAIVPFEVREGA